MTFFRTFFALVALACALTAVTGVATAGSDTTGDQYRSYALIRERLTSCSLDRTWRHLGSDARKRCIRIRKLYVLYADPGESYRYHVHCRTAKCPAAPENEPDPRGPIPSSAHVFH
jgi:hypothetical protein